MTTRKFLPGISFRFAILFAAVTLCGSNLATAQTETIIHQFGRGTDGGASYGLLAFDQAGNLYGTTKLGGLSGAGTVYELVRHQSSGATERILYNFSGGSDGAQPGGGVIFDAAGNLYGTTYRGGTANAGTVYQLKPPATSGGAWTENVLYSFGGGSVQDGAGPQSDLVFDAAGVLYGTTDNGGFNESGIVFQLTPPATTGGAWTETILHRFTNEEGVSPRAAVLFGKAGEVYGTLANGGAAGAGAVFRLRPPSIPGGHWTEKTLYVFTGESDGLGPLCRLIFYQGTLLGTTVIGGDANVGAVFQLTPAANPDDPWIETVLHTFTCGSDGCFPWAGLTEDKSGVFYGTTQFGGLPSNGGTVFSMTPPAAPGGVWTENVLYSFANPASQIAAAGLLLDKTGALYGSTIGSDMATGIAFKLLP
jgi:uncharacterized repeat protein (TIGR03803 family)